jgi:hypothetical protein
MDQGDLTATLGGNVVGFARRNGSTRRHDPSRVLDSGEIRMFWHQLARSSIDAPVQILLRLVLLTGRSKEQWATARWSEFDLANRLWVRGSMTLSGCVLEQLGALRNLTGPGARLLFPGLNLGRVTFCSSVDQCLRNNRAAFSLGILNSETLRLSALHYIGQIRRQTNKKQDALLLWGENCAELIGDTPDRIVRLSANR